MRTPKKPTASKALKKESPGQETPGIPLPGTPYPISDGTPDMTPAKKNHFHGNIGLSQRIMDELKMMNHALIVMA